MIASQFHLCVRCTPAHFTAPQATLTIRSPEVCWLCNALRRLAWLRAIRDNRIRSHIRTPIHMRIAHANSDSLPHRKCEVPRSNALSKRSRCDAGVQQVEVPQEFGDKQIERKMTTEDGTLVHEWITADELTKTVVFKTVNNPKMRGFVSNTLYEEDGGVWLDFTLNWVFKDEGMPDVTETMTGMIKSAVEHTKQLAEKRAAK